MKKEGDAIIPFKITCSVRSHSHRLNNEAFSLLMSGRTNLFVSEVEERSFSLSCVNETTVCKTLQHFALAAHLCFSAFIMALNITSLGRFTWNWTTLAPPLYKFIDPEHEDNTTTISLEILKKKENDIGNITANEVRNASLLYGALAKEKESNIRKEYIKGILHLGLDFLDINFNREAFGNFYRSFEYLATARILKVRKLSDELKELQKVITRFGLKDEIVEEFRSLYQLRSNQIMHAQKKQIEVKIDDVLKMKTILDVVLYKVYQPVWEKGINDLRADDLRKSPSDSSGS